MCNFVVLLIFYWIECRVVKPPHRTAIVCKCEDVGVGAVVIVFLE
jgi:hypothetical protein